MAGSYMFGAGALTVDAVAVGTQQGGELTIDAETVELYGAKDFPVDVASGKKRLTGKFSHGEIDADVIGKLLGKTPGSSGVVVATADMGAAAPFGITWTGTYRTKTATYTMPACVFKRLGIKWGNTTHQIVDAEFSAFADEGGNVITVNVA